ncbi:MAG: hypothetical protein ACLQVI_33695 [Polyangiaceae bacterium]
MSSHPQLERTIRLTVLSSCALVALAACGGGSTPPAKSASSGSGGSDSSSSSSSAPPGDAPASSLTPLDAKGVTHQCGSSPDKVQMHDLNSGNATETFVPCSKDGATDYSGAIKIETIPEGVHITIHATDDQVNLGMLGADVKTRDAVIVYPRGKGEKAIEVPLMKTPSGYVGDKIVMWDDLDKLTDEGTKFDIAVYDHDSGSGQASEEMHVSVGVSTGKSCERAQDENPQSIDMGAKRGGTPDLTDAQLGGPMRTSAWFAECGLADSSNADICVAVKKGKPLGVSVAVTPLNNRVAACIDRSARKLHWPESDKLDVVHQKF